MVRLGKDIAICSVKGADGIYQGGVRYGDVWYGEVQYGLVRFGAVRYGRISPLNPSKD